MARPKKYSDEFRRRAVDEVLERGRKIDETNNEGWVSVGDTADTAEFAVNSIRSWWINMGQARFPDATKLLITADAGGSNGDRVRAWTHTSQSWRPRPA